MLVLRSRSTSAPHHSRAILAPDAQAVVRHEAIEPVPVTVPAKQLHRTGGQWTSLLWSAKAVRRLVAHRQEHAAPGQRAVWSREATLSQVQRFFVALGPQEQQC